MTNNLYLLFFTPLLLGLFQGLLFAVLLVVRGAREERLSDYLLAALLIAGSLILLPILLGLLDIHLLWNEWLFLPLDPGLLIGPLLYLFVLAHTNRGFQMRRQQYKHFIPFAVYAIYHLIIFAQGRDVVFQWMDAVDLPYINPIYQLLTLISMSVYLVITVRHYRAYQRWLDTEFADPDQLRYPWITRFLWAIALTIVATCLLRLVETLAVDFDYVQAWFTSTMVAICTYYISIAGFMSARPPLTQGTALEAETETQSENRVNEEDLAQGLDQLVHWMESNQAYLDPELSLGGVARALGMSREFVSMVINSRLDKNFRGFVNAYRVEAFKHGVRAGKADGLTLFGLALDCGFNSKATFNRVFKQIEGITPNAFAEISKKADKQVLKTPDTTF